MRMAMKVNYKTGAARIMMVFNLVILCVFPLVYHDYYYDMLETKYQFYSGAAIVMAAAMLLWGVLCGKVSACLKGFSIKTLIGVTKKLRVVDWAMLAFWASNLISWFLCVDWRWDAFWGTQGRYNGLFLMTIYMIVYFFVTRFSDLKKYYLDAFLFVGVLACLFGITDYFNMDILGFKANLSYNQKVIYFSTFGNINTYTIYVGLVFAVSMILFACETGYVRTFLYYVVMLIAGIAIITGNSDNAYLSLGALFGFSPLYLFRSKRGFRRYWISVASFISIVRFVGWINVRYAEKVLRIYSLFNLAVKYEGFSKIIILFWALALSAGILTCFYRGEKFRLGRWLSVAWGLMLAAIGLTVLYVLYDANIAGNADKYAAVRNYVVFNEGWGTGRGFAWINCMEMFKEMFSPREKIFGFGPDTLRLLMENFYMDKIIEMELVFDNAHNEYLQYLMTIGIVGCVSYISFVISAIVRMARSVKGRPEVAACLFAVLAYITQAMVNLNLPIAMPFMIQLLSLGVCCKNRISKGKDAISGAEEK